MTIRELVDLLSEFDSETTIMVPESDRNSRESFMDASHLLPLPTEHAVVIL